MRGNAVRQLQKGPQPVQFAAAVQGNVVPTLSTGDHRAHRNHQNVGQAMLDFAAAARVCYRTKMLYQVLDRHNPLLLLTQEQVIRYQSRSADKNFMRRP
jgi:hypothetical protein